MVIHGAQPASVPWSPAIQLARPQRLQGINLPVIPVDHGIAGSLIPRRLEAWLFMDRGTKSPGQPRGHGTWEARHRSGKLPRHIGTHPP